VAFPLRQMTNLSKAVIEKRALKRIEDLELTEATHKFPSELSGGMQKRVALARALVKVPDVLLLDEPLGALDLKLRKEMQLELKALQQKVGITFIYVTHDQEEALTMSDRIAVMSKGKVMQVGTPVEIYERPNCRFVADFIGESNFFNGIVKSLDHGFASVYVPILKAELRGMPAEGIVAGDNVIVSVRPEKVRASEQAALNENSFQGRIAKSVYIGSESHVIVDVNGTILKVWEQNKISTLEPGAYHTPGSEVWLTLFPENTLILRDE